MQAVRNFCHMVFSYKESEYIYSGRQPCVTRDQISDIADKLSSRDDSSAGTVIKRTLLLNNTNQNEVIDGLTMLCWWSREHGDRVARNEVGIVLSDSYQEMFKECLGTKNPKASHPYSPEPGCYTTSPFNCADLKYISKTRGCACGDYGGGVQGAYHSPGGCYP